MIKIKHITLLLIFSIIICLLPYCIYTASNSFPAIIYDLFCKKEIPYSNTENYDSKITYFYSTIKSAIFLYLDNYADSQVEELRAKLAKINQGTSFNVQRSDINKGVLNNLTISGDLSDISPLEDITIGRSGCLRLDCKNLKTFKPLSKMNIRILILENTPKISLNYINTEYLSAFIAQNIKSEDFSPIFNSKLISLSISHNRNIDLSLFDPSVCNLTSVMLKDTNIKSIFFLKNMPIKSVDLRNSPISDLSPLKNGAPPSL